MNKRGWMLLIVFLLVVPSLQAISLTGNKLSPIIFEPGKVITNPYVVSDTEREVAVAVGGELKEYITVSEVKDNQFDLIIQFPHEYIAPGSYSFSLVVREVAGEAEPGIGTLLSVTKVFTIKAYSNEKEIAVALEAPHVNVGKPVNFRLHIESQGYQDIATVKGEITIYNPQRQVLGKITTEEKPLPALSSATLRALFPTIGLPPAEYYAEALVFYDGKQKKGNATFRIGTLDLLLKNYTSELFPGFNEITLQVANNWGNELRNVYAKLVLDGEELLQTPPITLAPWEEGTLEGIIKVEREPGTYPGVIHLFFEGESKEIPVEFAVQSLPQPDETRPQGNGIFVVFVVVISILIMIIIFLLVRKQNKGKKDEW